MGWVKRAISATVQAKDIPDAEFLAAVQRLVDNHPSTVANGFPIPAALWPLAAELELPDKLVAAKARRLIKRGLLDGCDCGRDTCRGDFTVVPQP